jgi:SAM-dependent methyltransferase
VSQPIFDPHFWDARVAHYRRDPRLAIYVGSKDKWDSITEEIVAGFSQIPIQPGDSVLDIGCGYGRTLDFMPKDWQGRYLGVDISPALIEVARENYPGRDFIVGDAHNLAECMAGRGIFDWCVGVWFKGMVTNHLGNDAWEPIEKELQKYAKQLVFVR